MPASRPLVLLAALLLAGGCRRPEVTAYEVPSEKDPDLGLAPATANNTNAGTEAGATAAPAGAPMAGASMADTAVPVAEGPGLAWTAPASWQAKAAGAMRKATYAVPGPGGATGDLSITAFPSDVGGELANVNRWRGQVQLPPVDEAGLAGVVTRWTQSGLSLTAVDFASPSGAQRMLGAIVPYNGGTWFFKLSGPAAAVGPAKADFMAFLHTVRPAQP
ncbi:MAG TPA: hypothetical protein VHC86_08495 [Opitutaceae bacterium]|nr:hypothetical protein [Opitutaceae bacterium]